uniref:TPR-like protein n=1 Tax=Mycena chlorophos TaxID=658473 RepID=A0ABQ0L8D6_MYCCL|nr:predicted protein [Mycena chlorophos]
MLMDPRFSEQFKVDASSAETLNAGYKAIAEFKKIGSTMEDAQIWLSSATKSWILLLDNADDIHLDLRKYLPLGAQGNILITSRNPDLAVHTGPKGMAVKIVDLAENEAIQLLQNRGRIQAGEVNQNATQLIVQELHYFPLAIVQAAGYISKTPSLQADLSQYLALYKKEKTELWRFQPSQSVDDYEETVYTTWKISFDQLDAQARQFLELCAFMNYEGIRECIFQWASEYHHVPEILGPTREQLEKANEFLSGFLLDREWDTTIFQKMIANICAYSLDSWHQDSFNMHPLVHEWLRSTQALEISAQTPYMVLGMAAASQSGISEQILLALHSITVLNFYREENTGFENKLASVIMAAGSYLKARELYSGVLHKFSALLGAEDPQTWQIIGELARCDSKLGKYKEAEEYQQKILDRQTAVLGEEHLHTLWSMNNLATSLNYLGKHAEAEKLEQKVLQKQITILGADHPATLGTMHNLATSLSNLGKYAEAEELQQKVLQRQITVLGADHPDTLWTMHSLAMSLCILGKLAEGEELQRKVLQRRTTVLGADHPDTLWIMHSLAVSLSNLGKDAEAAELEQKVLQRRIIVLGADHPDTMWAMHSIAVSLSNLGKHAEAEELQQKVLQRQRSVLGADHPDTLRTMHSLAASLSNLGKHSEAEELQQKVLQTQITVLGADHADTLLTMAALAFSYEQLCQFPDAQHLFKTVLEKQRAVLGQEHPHTLRTEQAIIRLEYKAQEPEAISAKAPRRRWKNFKMKVREAIFKS